MVEHLPRHTACQIHRRILAALVAVVDDVLGPPLANRHLHRVQHQFGTQVVRHRPADDLAAPGVEHDGEIEEARHRWHISDVGNPQLVRSGGAEVAVDQVGRRPVVLVPSGCCRAAVPMAGAHQARLMHQTGDPLAAVPLSTPTQIGMDARRPVGLPRTGMHRLDALQQGRVGRGVGGRWPLQPCVIARLGHAEHACHCGNRERGLVRAHEPEEPDGTCRSPERTRPRLLTECRAPAATACSHAEAGSTHHARPPSDREPPPPDAPRFGQPGRPTHEWSGRSAQTRGQDRQDYGQHGRGRPSVGEIPANTVGVFLASATPLAKASGCPPNRVNPNPAAAALCPRIDPRRVTGRRPRPGHSRPRDRQTASLAMRD